MTVPRHTIDIDQVKVRYENTVKSLPTFVSAVTRTPDNLPLLASNALDVVTCGSVVSPKSAEIIPALRLAARANAALFEVAYLDEFPAEVELHPGEKVVYTHPPDSSLVHANRWLDSFAIAALCRDYDAIQKLYGATTEMLRASTTRCPEYSHLFVDAICSFLEGAPDTGKRLLAAMDATDPNRDDILMPDWTLKIDVPRIELFFHFATGDKPAFDAALHKSVELHYSYWSKRKDADASRNPDGFLALWPLGMAALALDRNMTVSIDSEYCPMWLIRAD